MKLEHDLGRMMSEEWRKSVLVPMFGNKEGRAVAAREG